MKLRVKSDGTLEGTAVYAVDHDGNEALLEGVTAVAWYGPSAGDPAIVSVDIMDAEVDLIGYEND